MANVNIRIHEDLKAQAERVFSEIGLNTSAATIIFFKQVVRCGGLPFDLRLPEMALPEDEIGQAKKTKPVKEPSAPAPAKTPAKAPAAKTAADKPIADKPAAKAPAKTPTAAAKAPAAAAAKAPAAKPPAKTAPAAAKAPTAAAKAPAAAAPKAPASPSGGMPALKNISELMAELQEITK
ncbi:MAG: type II toxin-antitoxin system RelB/DinJ family antitoxin [Clostridiales Family XIII bacterium]|nr:type II toxin-antitoxin system RelB/DinJ family antitoxin [Clostridiales Family XIII bacterium]